MQTCYPVTRPARTTAPTALQEPVTVAEAKTQLRIAQAITAHDEELGRLIAQAREAVEKDSGVVAYTGSHTWKFTDFPNRDWFELPLRPVTSVTSIAYIDTSGTSTTWSSSEYALDTYTIQPIVRLVYGYSWPVARGDINGITVTFVAGYSSVLTIPQVFKSAVLLEVDRQFNKTTDAVAYDRLIELIRRSTYA